MKTRYSSRVECRGPRPDARSIPELAWGHLASFRLTGDFAEDHDTLWTRLAAVRDDDPEERIDIELVSREPFILDVWASDKKIANEIGFFIAMESHGRCL